MVETDADVLKEYGSHAGEVYNHLTVCEYVYTKWYYNPIKGVMLRTPFHRCTCDCGGSAILPYRVVRFGMIKHCGADKHYEVYGRRGRKRKPLVSIIYDDPEQAPSSKERNMIALAIANGYTIFAAAGELGAMEDYKSRLDAAMESMLADHIITKENMNLIYDETAKYGPRFRSGYRSTGPNGKAPKNYWPAIPMRIQVIPIQSDGTGMRFGILTIIGKERIEKRYVGANGYPTVAHIGANSKLMRYYRVRCDCGNELVVTATELMSHTRRSCGCAASWTDGALNYAQQHPGTHRDEYGNYRDADGFMIMIRTIEW